jgi:hypothetical protein
VVVDDSLLTLSDTGILASGLNDLSPRDSVLFS